jgi:hypothetical protein
MKEQLKNTNETNQSFRDKLINFAWLLSGMYYANSPLSICETIKETKEEARCRFEQNYSFENERFFLSFNLNEAICAEKLNRAFPLLQLLEDAFTCLLYLNVNLDTMFDEKIERLRERHEEIDAN